jgi:hypothetical protein
LAGGRPEREDGPAIVVLTAYDYPQYADAAGRLGAAGFVLKTAPLAEIVDAIRAAAAGGRALPAPTPELEPARPTARELDVLRLLVDGRRAFAQRPGRELGARRDIEALEEPAQVRFDGPRPDPQGGSDLVVAS